MNEAVAREGDEESGQTVSRPVLLKAAREAAGLHIAALSAALKVPVKKLEALEAGRYSELPDMTFARALASSACRHLKIDPAPILQQIPQGLAPKLGPQIDALNAPFNAGHDDAPINFLSWLSRPALLAAIALLLGALVIVFMPQAESPPMPAVGGPAMAEPVVVAEPVAAQEPSSPVAPDGTLAVASDTVTPTEISNASPASAQVPVQMSSTASTATVSDTPASGSGAGTGAGALLSIAATGESWVEVVNGSGNVVTKRLMQAGDVVDFSAAPPYTVVLGKVDAARVTVRGRAFDTAPFARNNVARFEVK
ncbi:helix-turn-helix domain-containing protein [Hydrogenophaga sp.]|uniref:helix-turn-helix domain-containing protein n=1 Tax=Hydrogenophaga sp. TaxID=1904254 RepID=UPI0027304B29|nr:helix-turn-helix domain-containing protein [Hydrogenophaga sp.]MDP1686442.1 helix-turn-helix domain-containing protein [Hydrogenophaga sp.]